MTRTRSRENDSKDKEKRVERGERKRKRILSEKSHFDSVCVSFWTEARGHTLVSSDSDRASLRAVHPNLSTRRVCFSMLTNGAGQCGQNIKKG